MNIKRKRTTREKVVFWSIVSVLLTPIIAALTFATGWIICQMSCIVIIVANILGYCN